ncbi:TPA: diaminopimelate decarboxylase [Candidatus Spyradomonas excrementavium]|nr:diaminopimelate decarboxylase [Candidatus Spyradomonas excrementavium]
MKPVTTKINENGHLEIGGCDLVELAEKYGTPLYVFDEKTIRTIANEYKTAFKDYPNINMLYAAKAFMTKAICKIMSSEGFGFDLVSGGEIYTAHSAGVDMSKCLFNGNNKSYEELQLALEVGVGKFSVDNFLELALLNEAAGAAGKKADILLRITPGIECHTHEYIQTGHLDSKFGFDLTQIDDALELLRDEYENLNVIGLHAHIGSQIFETKIYYDEVEVILKEIARIREKFGIELHTINLGGGLGIKYTENDLPPTVEEIARQITSSVEENSKKYNTGDITIFIEPGRSIIGTSGVTLYTVGSSKQVPKGRKYVAVDGGMADNPRPSLYQALYTAQVANKPEAPLAQTITLAGRFCESGDILIKDVKMPELEEGDIICVYDTGAYGYSMSSNYNRVLKPAAVLVNHGQSDIIINRESYEHLVSLDVIPERLR